MKTSEFDGQRSQPWWSFKAGAPRRMTGMTFMGDAVSAMKCLEVSSTSFGNAKHVLLGLPYRPPGIPCRAFSGLGGGAAQRMPDGPPIKTP